MKRLTCEMCGGTDLIKQDGVFVCQNCGIKYSVEEAKKMMIEGTVEVQGTVKVDNSDFVQKYLENARRAYDKRDWEETEKYYNLVEQNDPKNIEAIFYSAYAKACSTLIDADFFKKEYAFGVLRRSVSVIDDNYDPSEKEIVERVGNDLINLININFVYTQKKNGYGTVVQDDRAKTVALFYEVCIEFIESCCNIVETYPKEDSENRLYFYRIASNVANVVYKDDFYDLAVKYRKLAYPELANTLKKVTIYNNTRQVHYLTIPGVFEKRTIPKGWSSFEIVPGKYECVFCLAGWNKSETLFVPQFKQITISHNISVSGCAVRFD